MSDRLASSSFTSTLSRKLSRTGCLAWKSATKATAWHSPSMHRGVLQTDWRSSARRRSFGTGTVSIVPHLPGNCGVATSTNHMGAEHNAELPAYREYRSATALQLPHMWILSSAGTRSSTMIGTIWIGATLCLARTTRRASAMLLPKTSRTEAQSLPDGTMA